MRVITPLLLLAALFVLGRCKPRNADTPYVPYTMYCPSVSAPADIISIPSHAGYITNFQGGYITSVTYYGGTNAPGTYSFTLTIRDSSFGGPVLGTANATVGLPLPSVGGSPITFTFSPSITVPGALGKRTLTFEVTNNSGGTVYAVYDPNVSATCPMVQTNGNTAPLDTANGTRAWAVTLY